ncbi:MAG: hypothetical protein ACJ72L_13675 [Marmoricola sp.]
MRAVEEILAAVSCPVAQDEEVAALLAMGEAECLESLVSWATQVFELNPFLGFELDLGKEEQSERSATIAFGDFQGSVIFRLLTEASLLALANESTLGSLRLNHADVTVVAVQADPSVDACAEAVSTLQRKAGAPVPNFVLMDPRWLAAAVVSRSKPFAYGALTQPGRLTPEPYFRAVNDDGVRAATAVERSQGSLREAVGASIIEEPASLPEKFRLEGTRTPVPVADLTIVTTFLPPVTHSVQALTRYFSREGVDRNIVESQVLGRQERERAGWMKQLERFQLRLIVDRQQIEEYCSEPEYYQMVLTPDELDEQIASLTEWFASPNFSMAMSPEAVDLPFHLQGDTVVLRGDRRNRSEPRPGRLSGMRLTDKKVADEFRHESWSLMQLTEAPFKSKEFIQPWLASLARSYRRDYRRQR